MLYEGLPDRLFGVSGQWNLRKCDNPVCGSTWLDPMPLECDLPIAYRSYYTHGSDNLAVRSKRQIITRNFVHWLEQAWLALIFLSSERKKMDHMYLERFSPGRLLEVGCGNGTRLIKMQKLDWEVEGQDVDIRAVESARLTYGLTTHLGDLAQLRLPAESYHAIIMNHVIEHVYDPIVLLQECLRLLKPGGVVVIVTPNPNSFGHSSFKEAWRGLEVPRHLHLFTAHGLSQLAMKAGFVQCKSWTTPAHTGVISAASLDIRSTGRHVMGSQRTGLQTIMAMLYQLRARVLHFWQKDSGDESVLLATK
ncbi:MAG: class I SAM-dependent methyltransferase [Methylobacter sp.]|nr:class I SAM-dependent methyltransferase [Methylobacter sp.]